MSMILQEDAKNQNQPAARGSGEQDQRQRRVSPPLAGRGHSHDERCADDQRRQHQTGGNAIGDFVELGSRGLGVCCGGVATATENKPEGALSGCSLTAFLVVTNVAASPNRQLMNPMGTLRGIFVPAMTSPNQVSRLILVGGSNNALN